MGHFRTSAKACKGRTPSTRTRTCAVPFSVPFSILLWSVIACVRPTHTQWRPTHPACRVVTPHTPCAQNRMRDDPALLACGVCRYQLADGSWAGFAGTSHQEHPQQYPAVGKWLVEHPFKNKSKMPQHLDLRCVLLPLVPGVTTKTRLASRIKRLKPHVICDSFPRPVSLATAQVMRGPWTRHNPANKTKGAAADAPCVDINGGYTENPIVSRRPDNASTFHVVYKACIPRLYLFYYHISVHMR